MTGRSLSNLFKLLAVFAGLASVIGVFYLYTKGYRITAGTGDKTTITNSTPQDFSESNGKEWKLYEDKATGFTVEYPADYTVNGQEGPKNIRVSSEPLETLTFQPIVGGKDEAMKDMQDLSNGIVSSSGFAADASIYKIGSINGKVSTTLSQFEVCSVMFVKRLVFYPNNYRVTVSFSGDTDTLIADMPGYFTVDSENCGDEKVWDRTKTGDFILALNENRGGKAVQTWNDTFLDIIGTIRLTREDMIITKPSVPVRSDGCEVSDNAFCNVLSDLKNSVAKGNSGGFLSYQTESNVTCDPDGWYFAICDGEAKGTVKTGFQIGYYQSEGTVVLRDEYIRAVNGYMIENGPFTYKGSTVSGDLGKAVFLNKKGDMMIAFPMKRTGATWRMSYVLLGLADKDHAELSGEILNF